MLTKFESKSSRAKGIAFHAKRPWILVSLHSSTIQLWDYRMGTLIDRFEEHDGPVRGVDFHRTQPLFVSGGDDYKIKVWSYQTRRCLFTLNGHLDYVRTVFFHHELPWILSSSDDQTIRIWNWQNRSLICTMTGHNHYVMCAQFHPKDDLIVSASLDQSVRVWDISGLRKKHSAPTSVSFEDQMARANTSQADMFGNTDAVVKFVLEGHDRGVNWVAFHPNLPLIVSAGDDRLIKLWRMSETKAWEVDTCRGHYQNASACLFHPHQDLILSVGEDKTIRAWDLNKRTSVQAFKRESDRFWVIAAHPEINLFAAGHDNGVMVFKLDRERPASTTYQHNLYFITKDRQVHTYDFQKHVESPSLPSMKNLGSPWVPFRSLSYNPAERGILVTSTADAAAVYFLITLPLQGSGAETVEFKQGPGNSAVFVARNRFAVFTQATQLVEIKDLSNTVTKSFPAPHGTTDICFGGTGNVLLLTPTTIALYDIQKKKSIAELSVNGVKYVVWSGDGQHAALLSKHNVTIVTRSLEQLSSLHETIRLKSATWDDAGVLLYSTLNHVKYALPNGDNGIVRTLDQTVYLVKVKGRSLYSLDRSAKPRILDIDPTEYRFKLALIKRDYAEMLKIIKTSSLVGQSIIAYLQKKGYPEIALQFVQDPQTRFDLAVECGNLEVAIEMAKKLDRAKLWARLGTEALSQGNHQVVEMVYQKLRQFDKLSFLYLVTGNEEKLQRMGKIAERRGDFSSRLQNALYLDDVGERIQMFKEVDLYPLAYLTAKSHGLNDECQAILEASGLREDLITLPSMGEPVRRPTPVVATYKARLPAKSAVSTSMFEKALLGQVEGPSLEDDDDNNANKKNKSLLNGAGFVDAVDDVGGAQGNPEDDEEGAGWDIGDDINAETEENLVQAEDDLVDVRRAYGGPGTSEAELWDRASYHPADLVAAGSFTMAVQLLNCQVGAVNFEPLKPRFLEIYQASRTYLPATFGSPPLVNFVRRNVAETNPMNFRPNIPWDFQSIKEGDLQAGYTAMRQNNLEEGVRIFKKILHTLMVTVAGSAEEAVETKNVIPTAARYALAMSIELARRALPADDEANLKRSLELFAYFTVPKLEVSHRQFALVAAMMFSASKNNLSSALHFANQILANGGSPKMLERARTMKARCERNPYDKHEVDFDQYADFDICAASYTPIYKGTSSSSCPWDGTMYHAQYKGQVCRVCEVIEIGKKASSY